MSNQKETFTLELRGVDRRPLADGSDAVRLETDAGAISCRLHTVEVGDAAIIWVGGAGGGLVGPAGGLYPRLAEQLAPHGIASLRLDYRRPNHLTACVLDTLLGVAYLGMLDRRRIALVGHSFGGAIVITAGAISPAVVAVAALSSQTAGTSQVGQLGPRPLLLMHGMADEILPDACSRDLYRRAKEPKTIKLYQGCGHGLDECRHELDRDLLAWLRQVFSLPAGD